jgi:phosphoesterase RecJ-like protein
MSWLAMASAERILALKKKQIPLINIDHHPKNDIWREATVNHVNPEASSACEIVYEIIENLGVGITPHLATALLMGIYTDTGGFRHPNTSQSVLNITSKLLNQGAKLRIISENVSNSRSVAMLKLWGIALSRIHKSESGLVLSVVTREDIEAAKANDDDLSGVVNMINTIPGAKVAMLLSETPDGKIKASLRTESERIDVSKIAAFFGGGGHRKAAGFTITGRLEKIDTNRWKIVG